MTAKELLRSHQGGDLLAPAEEQVAAISAGPPILIVAIDTEAEFDWRGPFRRSHTSVRNLRNQQMAQAIFDRFGVRPIYLVDYAVASQPDGYLPLQDFLRSGRCEIGAHLHPWITPPFTEKLSERTSFSQNLPPTLQREKLARLTEAIVANLGVRPLAYRAGRYGVGEEISEVLASLGYEIDMSVLPGIDMRPLHGPDFREGLDSPYWFGRGNRLLEIPSTPCFTGLLAHPALLRSHASRLYDGLASPRLNRLRLRGVFARLRLLDRIPPTPEGVTPGELRRLARTLLRRGNRVFVFSYHSSSLLPGNTEYVRTPAELSRFLRTIEQFLEFFIGELGGTSLTPSELRTALLRQPGAAAAASGSLPAAAQ